MSGSSSRAIALLALAVAVVGALGVVTGCESSTPKGGDLVGINWLVKSWAVEGESETVPSGSVADATFTKSQVSGRVLNSYSGPFVTDDKGNVTKVGPFAMTKMAGPPEIMALEAAYILALQKAKSYYSDGKKLTLYGDDDEELVVYEKSDVTIVGNWRVTTYNNGKQAVVSVIPTTTVTASFGADEKVSGNAGINTYGGEYSTEGADGISIGQLSTTRMAGPEDAMAQETAYLAALQSATTYSISGKRLEMRNAEDAIAVQMERAP